MSAVIRAENLGKRYRLGKRERAADDSLVMAVWNTLRSPFDNYRRIKSLTRFDHPDDTTFWALKDVSFEVQPGEVLGVIGHNGAGKSTLLKILSRITDPTTGEILIKGRVSALLEVGTGFHPDLTGRENVYMNGTILGMTKKEIDRKFDEIVDFSGVEQYIDTPVKFYSSGMKVRLGFAVAAHLEPEILIVDEVLAVGDIGFQRKCLGKMDEVSKSGRTILFVSHNMAAVQNLCTRALLLSHGKIVADGSVTKVVEAYISEFSGATLSNSLQTDAAHRNGSGLLRFEQFYVENHAGHEIRVVESGSAITFVFGIRRRSSSGLKNVDVGFSVHAADDDRLLMILYSSYVGKLFDVCGDYVECRCRLDSLPLPEGRYLIKGQIMMNQEVVDCPVRGLGYLEVVEGDFFGTGVKAHKLTRIKPEFLIKGIWC